MMLITIQGRQPNPAVKEWEYDDYNNYDIDNNDDDNNDDGDDN